MNIIQGDFSVATWLLPMLVRFLCIAGAVYLHLGILLPRFFFRERYAAYVVLLLLAIVIATGLQAAWEMMYVPYVTDMKVSVSMQQALLGNSLSTVAFVVVSSSLHFTLDYFRQRKKARVLEVEHLQTELMYLRSQMNPHFLFNSINSVYGFIDKKNTEARGILIRFADLLRYQLYECNDPKVPFNREVQFLDNYIAFQKIRKDEALTVTTSFTSQQKELMIPPLLFVPFIENAFKHVSSYDGKPNSISIVLEEKNNEIYFTCVNSKEIKRSSSASFSGGIGIANIKRRLELLFAHKQQLTIHDADDRYQVTLKIQL